MIRLPRDVGCFRARGRQCIRSNPRPCRGVGDGRFEGLGIGALTGKRHQLAFECGLTRAEIAHGARVLPSQALEQRQALFDLIEARGVGGDGTRALTGTKRRFLQQTAEPPRAGGPLPRVLGRGRPAQ